jgi:hypothetical protein
LEGKVKLPEIKFLPKATTLPTDVEYSAGYPDLQDMHDPISTIINLTGYKVKYLILQINEIPNDIARAILQGQGQRQDRDKDDDKKK